MLPPALNIVFRIIALLTTIRALLLSSVLIMTSGLKNASSLDVYAGGEVGRSDVRNDQIFLPITSATPYSYDESHVAWQAAIGMRPIQMAGAEFTYIDFGHSSVNETGIFIPFIANARVKGPGAFAVVYAPPVFSHLDLYGKVGAAHLQTNLSANNVGHFICRPGLLCTSSVFVPNVFTIDSTNWDLAYGAGAQYEFSSLIMRVEYERARVSGGDPDFAGLGVFWRF